MLQMQIRILSEITTFKEENNDIVSRLHRTCRSKMFVYSPLNPKQAGGGEGVYIFTLLLVLYRVAHKA